MKAMGIKRPKTLRLASAGLILAVALVGMASVNSFAGAEQKKEVSEVTKKKVYKAIKSYIHEDLGHKKKFLVMDPRSGKPLALMLDHVHPGVYPHERGYRGCADFKDESGTIYDVDVLVSMDSGQADVTAVWLHKVNGKVVATKP